MEFIGEYLKDVRIKKNLNLLKISQELNISKNLLEDIENDYFPEYINTVFLIGHIRAYAKLLNIDHEVVVENFKIQTSYNALYSKEEISKPIQTIKIFSFGKIFSISSIFVVAISFYFLFIKPTDLQPEYAMTPDVPENLQYNLEEAEMNISILQNKDINKKVSSIIFDSDMALIEEESQSITSSSVIASLQNENHNAILSEKITLRFLKPTWIQLRDSKDRIIISKLMSQGDEYSYSLSDNLNLTAGNAGNIIISLNGVVKGKAGKVGQVVESLIIDSNFLN